MSAELPTSIGTIRTRIRELLGLTGDATDLESVAPSLEALLRHTRRQLLDCARYLGLTGIHRLTKPVLAQRFQEALESLAREVEPAEQVDHPHKFDLGYTSALPVDSGNIPWGYGQDRVTAMAVDPERLYVYWEVTDEAIARAREGLGPGGPDAVLTLRVYDVTARIFDGTNAHAYFDHTVARTDRQWFFFIGKPTSTVIVEVGLKSRDGYFVRVARSGRLGFPRRAPVAAGGVEWLTVRAATGEPGEPTAGTYAASPPTAPVGHATDVEPLRVWDIRRTHGGTEAEWVVYDERVGEWSEEGTVEWEGPLVETSWEAGPFESAVDAPPYVEERHGGTVTVRTVSGRTHVVHGPWRVVIRGLGARAERKVLGVWELRRSWVTNAGVVTSGTASVVRGAGGSEALLRGASERRWLAGSELRLGGASEVYRLGASELRYLGATETVFVAASEWRLGGASERRFAGAASEQRHAGASERHLGYPEEPDAS